MKNPECMNIINDILNKRLPELDPIIDEIMDWDDEIIIILSTSNKGGHKYNFPSKIIKEIEESTSNSLHFQKLEIVLAKKKPDNPRIPELDDIVHVNLVFRNVTLLDSDYTHYNVITTETSTIENDTKELLVHHIGDTS